jgi:hypothetical protein
MPHKQRRPQRPSSKKIAVKERARTPRKLVAIDPGTLRALELLARDRMQEFNELADEAFRDVLKKHRRPVTLKEALKQSARVPDNDEA